MDELATGDSPLHQLDARTKILTTFLFIVTVVSFNKYEVSALTPFFLYPIFLISLGRLPASFLMKKILLVSPLAVMVGLFNPLLDTETLMQIGRVAISGGWLSFISILERFALTVSAAMALVSLTGMNALCEALIRLGLPKPFVVQLLFLNRYIFVLGGEVERMSRARALRSCGRPTMNLNVFIQLVGHLLLRTIDRAERVYQAMLCRGFEGHIRVVKFSKIGRRDIAFVLIWAALFALFRCADSPLLLGHAVIGFLK